MKVADFNFELPERLIAKYPAEQRSGSRLLVLDGRSGELQHRTFADLVELVNPGDLLVFNDTKVVPARLFGRKATGGKVEILFERGLSTHVFFAHVRASKAPKAGSKIVLDSGIELLMQGREGALFRLETPDEIEVFTLLEQFGHIPLPPYIDRADESLDEARYQTVYARHRGAAAAPTAGLHFDDALFTALKTKGVNSAFVTLHVGAGTFQPVKVDHIEDHHMHSEWLKVDSSVVDLAHAAKQQGGRVIAVGTTSVRALESASRSGELQPFTGDTDIFIYPGYRFHTVDALITNFHLPQSTLLMLVSAFAGQNHIVNAYASAIAHEYRFFSYGDAMFLSPQSCAREF